MDWYYMDGDRKIGPINDEAFHSLLSASVITAETPVWRQGWSEWHKSGDSKVNTPPPFKKTITPPRRVFTHVPSPVSPETEAPSADYSGRRSGVTKGKDDTGHLMGGIALVFIGVVCLLCGMLPAALPAIGFGLRFVFIGLSEK